MKSIRLCFLFASLLCLASCSHTYDVTKYGAVGDGVAIDSPAVNTAIAKASEHGGTVVFPEGEYLCYSIHMMSGVTLRLEKGAVIRAAKPTEEGEYDHPEPNPWDMYQDFGHSHWHNSLIWGEGLNDIAFEGEGIIDGTDALDRWDPAPGGADKAIALKECKDVRISGLTFLNSGHFSLLLTGVDGLLIDGITVDTNRDAIDVDCCSDVVICNCDVNSLNDDAIVLKCSYGLGYAKATENVHIYNCHVSGYDPGTFFDGTMGTTITAAPDRDGPTGRIKLGTESNGGFRNMIIEDCDFFHCRGLALESVDGALMEDIVVRNIRMKDIVNSPIYIRVGDRMRGPEGLPKSAARNITISDVTVEGADCRYATLIIGMPESPIENVTMKNITITYNGGLSMDDFEKQLGTNSFFKYDGAVYPEPSAHGIQPAWGLSVSYAKDIKLENVEMSLLAPDGREKVYIGPDVTDFTWK